MLTLLLSLMIVASEKKKVDCVPVRDTAVKKLQNFAKDLEKFSSDNDPNLIQFKDVKNPPKLILTKP